jgi:hypothetical protein
MGRAIGGLLTGLLAAGVLVLAIETAGLPLFPPPAGMDPLDPESIRRHLAEIHPGSFILVLIAWSAGAFAGPWVTRRIAGNAPAWPTLVVVLLFLMMCAYNLVVVPTPIWMTIGAIILVPAATWFGMRAPLARLA